MNVFSSHHMIISKLPEPLFNADLVPSISSRSLSKRRPISAVSTRGKSIPIFLFTEADVFYCFFHDKIIKFSNKILKLLIKVSHFGVYLCPEYIFTWCLTLMPLSHTMCPKTLFRKTKELSFLKISNQNKIQKF